MKYRHSFTHLPGSSGHTLTLALAVAALISASQAATRLKQNNSDALNLPSSWDFLPGAADIAQWDFTVTAANTTALGGNLSFAGIKIVDPGGPVTISGANTLTVGTSGIDLSAATQNLTIASGLHVQGRQSWRAPGGLTLNVAGTFTRHGAMVDFTNFNDGATLGTLANVNGILGPWATTGSATSLQYVTGNSGAISAFTGATAATTGDLTNVTSDTANYTYSAGATLAGNQSGNTLRYSGGASTTALGANSLTLNGLLHAGTGNLTITSTPGNPGLVTGASGELHISSNAQVLTLGTRITGTGRVVYNAVGNITFGAGAGSVGASNDYSGGTVINSTTELRTVGAGSFFGTGPVTVNGGLMFISNNTLSNDFTFNGGLPTMNNSFASTLNGTITLAVTTSWQLNTNGNMVINGQVTGPGGLTKTQGLNNGPLQLANANNDYAGPTTVSAGVLQVRSSLYGNDQAKWTPANITVASGATFALNIGGASDFSTTDAGTMLTNLLTSVDNNGLTAGSMFGLSTANAAGTVTFATTFTDSTGTGGGAVGIRKLGANTLELTGANTYSGRTRIDAGTLTVDNIAAIGAASSPLGAPSAANEAISIGHIASTGTLRYTGPGHSTDRTIQIGTNSAGGPVTGDTGGAIIQNDGTGPLTFIGLNFNTQTNATSGTGANRTLTLQGSNGGSVLGIIRNNLSIAGTSTIAITKAGAGTWVLVGENTYTGATAINGGALQAISGTGLPTNSTLQLRGGVFQSSGTFSRVVSTAAGALNWATSSGGFAAKGAPLILNLNGGTESLTWNGNSMVPDGQRLIFGSTTADDLVDFQNGLNLGSGSVLTRTITVNDNPLSSTDRARFSGEITNVTDGMSLLKDGAGTLELTNANTYSGTTTVSGGTLLVSNTTGSGTGSGDVSATTGTLGGSGSLSGSVIIGNGDGSGDAILAPGNMVGTLAIGNLTFNSDGNFACELNGTAVTSDRANVTGFVAIDPAATLTVSLTGSLSIGQKYFTVVNDGTDSITGTFAGLDQASVVGTFGGTNLRISYTGDSVSSAITGGNDIVLYTEASGTPYGTWALGAFAKPFTNPLPEVDFDNDGLSNLLEFVLGGDPTISQAGIAPTTSVSGGKLILSFRRSDASELAPAVAVKVELSTGLTFTTPADDITVGPATDPGPIAPSSASYTVVNSGGFDTITVSIPQGAAPRRFARVKATQTP